MTWSNFTSLVPVRSSQRSSDEKPYEIVLINSFQIQPDANPASLFFASPSDDSGLTPPSIRSTTKDFFGVTLSGMVEIIIGFDSFQATPLDPSDQMDPVAIHALEWAAWPRIGDSGGSSSTRGAGNAHVLKGDSKRCEDKPQDIEWRPSFEHAKVSSRIE